MVRSDIVLSRTGLREAAVRILKTKWFTQFAAKNKIPDPKLREAIEEIERGIIDADLGGGLIKKRIARCGVGKSGGYRTLIAYRKGKRAFFIFGFSKNQMENVEHKDLAALKDAARQYAKLTDTQVTDAVANGKFTELLQHEKKIQK
jgi:hypothetical protein